MSVTIPTEFQVIPATSLAQFVLESISDFAVISSDTASHIMRWDQDAFRILGWTAEEMIGQHASVSLLRQTSLHADLKKRWSKLGSSEEAQLSAGTSVSPESAFGHQERCCR